jgi:hypothetical protein
MHAKRNLRVLGKAWTFTWHHPPLLSLHLLNKKRKKKKEKKKEEEGERITKLTDGSLGQKEIIHTHKNTHAHTEIMHITSYHNVT